MRILIIFDHVTDSAAPDQADVLVQARAVSAALDELGHEWMTLGVTFDLDAAKNAIERLAPDLAFNLVESLGGHGRLIHVVPAMLDAMGVPYTGASAEAQFITSHKPLAKRLLRSAGIATPDWLTLHDLQPQRDGEPLEGDRWIVKSLWEHASVGLGADSVIESNDRAVLRAALEDRLERLGGSGFIERYIDGREFNLAILGDERGRAEALAPSEIVFHDYPDGAARIVNYQAKWDEASFEYQHTLRRLDFARGDALLLQSLRDLAVRCWQAFDLRGYARVDVRVDAGGRPFVLEINTNPCLSPDAGFAAALRHAGIEFAEAVRRIVCQSIASRVPCR